MQECWILTPPAVLGRVAAYQRTRVPSLGARPFPLEFSPVGQHQCTVLCKIQGTHIKDPVWSCHLTLFYPKLGRAKVKYHPKNFLESFFSLPECKRFLPFMWVLDKGMELVFGYLLSNS